MRVHSLKRAATVMLVAASVFTWSAAKAPEEVRKGFAWGGDIGGAVDMSGHDMSTMNIDAYFGYSCSTFQMIGVGAGINIPVDNSYRTFPIYGIVQSSLSNHPRGLFADLRVGCVYNERPDGGGRADFYCSPGLGIRLAYGKKYSSYIVAGYVYNGMRGSGYIDETSHEIKGLHAAVVRLGIRF